MNLVPKNWSEFQHYKDRAPTWIKLHRSLLDDYTFACLPVASRALAPLLWLLASEYENGVITASHQEIAFRLRMSERDLRAALNPLIEKRFFILVQDASEPLAERKQDACLEREIEEEKQVEKETESVRSVAVATRPPVEDDFEKFWKAYPKRGDASNPKKPAREKFERAVKAGADPAIIINAADRFAQIEAKAGRAGTEKVAQAVTWLNQQRWNDYPLISAIDCTGPPKPPSASMQSDSELRAKYAARAAELQQDREPENAGVLPASNGLHPGGPEPGRDQKHGP